MTHLPSRITELSWIMDQKSANQDALIRYLSIDQ